DREMVLRFIAFMLHAPDSYDTDDFDGFLRRAMHELNDLPVSHLSALRARFDAAMDAALAVFGEHAFRQRDPGGGPRRVPINKALFEAVAVSLTMNGDRNKRLTARKARVATGMVELMNNAQFQSAISQGTGDIGKVKLRFSSIESLFERVTR